MPIALVQFIVEIIELIRYKLTTLTEEKDQDERPSHQDRLRQNLDWIWVWL